MDKIVVFDEVKAEIAEYKIENERIVFDYEDPQGNKDARSHIFKLRKAKTAIGEIHKTAKADALAICKAIDGEKRDLIKDVEEMIDVHAAPIKAIEDRKTHEAFLRAEEVRKAREAEEERKRKEIEDREAEVSRKEAEFKAKEESMEAEQQKAKQEAFRIEREKRIADEAAEKARKEAEAKTKAKENARRAKEAADAERERKRIADETYRELVHARIQSGLYAIIKDHAITDQVVTAIREGKIEHITIKY